MDENKNKNNNNHCSICLHFIEIKFTTNCEHDFCYECIVKALKYNKKQECPLCKQDLKTFSLSLMNCEKGCDDDEFNKQIVQQQISSSSNTSFLNKFLKFIIYSAFIAGIYSIIKLCFVLFNFSFCS